MKTLTISDDNINHIIRKLRSLLEGFSLLVNNNPISIKECFDLSLENIEREHSCCSIGDSKHQIGVDNKKKWIKK